MQIVTTVIIFIVTLTRGAPAFPVLIIALVPFRLLVMKRWWPREALRFVDAWACREGTPEDDEDSRAKENDQTAEEGVNLSDDGVLQRDSGIENDRVSPNTQRKAGLNHPSSSRADITDQEIWGMTDDDMDQEWIGLENRNLADEEFGHHRR